MATRCTDCGGGTPWSYWLRCYECAMRRLRVMMSPFPITPGKIVRRFAIGSRAMTPDGAGKVARVQNADSRSAYVVDLDKGGRYYGTALTEDLVHAIACDLDEDCTCGAST